MEDTGVLMNDESQQIGAKRIEIPLSDEEISAVDGWRKANGVGSREAAVRQLLRLGLLSEIGRIYQSVSHD